MPKQERIQGIVSIDAMFNYKSKLAVIVGPFFLDGSTTKPDVLS